MPPPTKRRRTAVRPSTAGGALEASLDLSGETGAIATTASTNPNASFLASLPKIPGVPVQEVPVFLHALKATAKFFQTGTTTKQSFTVVDWEKLQNGDGNYNYNYNYNDTNIGNTRKNPTANVHDTIMNRMEAAANNADDNDNANADASNSDQERLQTFVRAVSNWMKDVRFLATRTKGPSQSKSQPPTSGQASGGNTGTEPPQIPYSMFLYLWELQQEHKRVNVRRAGLFLSGWLLLRSIQCRSYLDQETHLADWVASVADLTDAPSASASAARTLRQRSLLQKEAMALVSHLLDKGYGRLYSKLAVAAKSLEQRCAPSAVEEASAESWTAASWNGAAQRRTLRDLALRHGPKELAKVERLLDRAEGCLLILVPRLVPTRTPVGRSPEDEIRGEQSKTKAANSIGEERTDSGGVGGKAANTSGSVGGNADNHRDNDIGIESDSDESDIDWEDGNDDQGNLDQTNIEDLDRRHLSAVERTMVAMEQTSGTTLFDGGALEIDFDRRVEEHEGGAGDADPASASRDTVRARKRLRAIVRKLSDTHLIRLSAWLDGLRHSDGLKAVVHLDNDESSGPTAASLVAVSAETNALRRKRIDELSAAKHNIARVVASAVRLLQNNENNDELENGSKEEEDSNPRPATTGPALALSSATTATARTSAKQSNPAVNHRTTQRRPRRRIEIRFSPRTPGNDTTCGLTQRTKE